MKADIEQYEFTFDGPCLEPEIDFPRLGRQFSVVFNVMLDGQWRTLGELGRATGYPQASISARLRDMRKMRFGSHEVQRRNLGDGLFAYRLICNPRTTERLLRQTKKNIKET